MTQMNSSMNRNRPTDKESRRVVPPGKGCRGEMDRDFGVNRCILLCVEWINAKSYCIAEGPIFNILG